MSKEWEKQSPQKRNKMVLKDTKRFLTLLTIRKAELIYFTCQTGKEEKTDKVSCWQGCEAMLVKV